MATETITAKTATLPQRSEEELAQAMKRWLRRHPFGIDASREINTRQQTAAIKKGARGTQQRQSACCQKISSSPAQ